MRLLAAAVFFAVAAGSAAPLAPSAPAVPPQLVELPGQDVELKTQDGWTLKAKYEPAQPDKRTIILLHGRGQRKEAWVRLVRGLRRAGFGYLALDLRGHGESATAPDGSASPWRKFKATKAENDYAPMTLDVQAAVTHLTESGVSEEAIALIGDALGGSIALKYAAVHPRVPLVVMLSPGLSYQEVTTVNAMRAYKDRPILMIYGELDKNSAASAPILYSYARRLAGERNATMLSVPGVHGNKLLNGARVRKIVAWLEDPVKPEVPEAPTEAPAAEGAAPGDEPADAPAAEDAN